MILKIITTAAILFLALPKCSTAEELTLDQVGLALQSTEELLTIYDEFRKLHGRTGSMSRNEFTKRLALFRRSLVKIYNMKADNEITWKVGITLMADMTESERMILVGVNVTTIYDRPEDRNTTLKSSDNKLQSGSNPPEEWDWRNPTPQDNVGSFVTEPVEQHWKNCWVYAAVTPVETLLKLHTQQLVELSTQELYDCTYDGNNVEGSGRFRDAWDWIRKSGRLGTRKDIPDRPKSRPTHFMKLMYEDHRNALEGFRLGDTLWVSNEEEMLSDIYSRSPVGVAMQIEGLHLDVYKGELFQQHPAKGIECYKKSKHAMAVVGYNRFALVIKNSWGKEWGHEGYLLWVRGQKNSCGMYEVAGSISMIPDENALQKKKRVRRSVK